MVMTHLQPASEVGVFPSAETTLAMGDVAANAEGNAAIFHHYAGGGTLSPVTHTDVTISVFVGNDGTTVVQIDTDGDDRLRININDATIFDQGVETGLNYET